MLSTLKRLLSPARKALRHVEPPPPSALPKFSFNIDVLGFGACNLTCPSCPVGNMREVDNPKGMLEPELLRAILEKAQRECEVEFVCLFNWSEPLLHPRLPELVRVVRSMGIHCELSSNLNKLKNIEAVLAADPNKLRISNSGFTQDVYSVTHRGGDIEQVKRNMIELMETKKRVGANTHIHLLYHRYKTNLGDEESMKNFCAELGIEFVPVWAFYIPVEKILSMQDADGEIAITSEDRDVMDRLLLPIPEALAAAQVHREKECHLQTRQMTLDCHGQVQLCCATYDSTKFTLGSFLDHSLEELQAMKYQNQTCTRCMNHGVHVYYMYAAPEFEQIARSHAAQQDLAIIDKTQVYSNA
jgi:MoaA/NifB/PqqE/SkfB family radical SAM enzyme